MITGMVSFQSCCQARVVRRRMSSRNCHRPRKAPSCSGLDPGGSQVEHGQQRQADDRRGNQYRPLSRSSSRQHHQGRDGGCRGDDDRGSDTGAEAAGAEHHPSPSPKPSTIAAFFFDFGLPVRAAARPASSSTIRAGLSSLPIP